MRGPLASPPPCYHAGGGASMRWWLVSIVSVVLLFGSPTPALAQGQAFCQPGESPQFTFGFASLKAQIGAAKGDPIECAHPNSANGDVLQNTTTGLSFWRKSTNTPTFTNGWEHWGLTPSGLVFWTGESIDPPGTVVAESPPPPAPAAPSTPARPPTPAPAPAPPTPPRGEPITLSGRGQTATNPVTLPSPVSVATFTHDGQRNFIVRSFIGGNATLQVNTIGRYQGQRPVSGSTPVTFDIQADGAWTVRIEPVGLNGSAPFSGRGDLVSALFTPPSNGPWEFSHDGSRNFIVRLHCASGSRLVQNTIGGVQGSTIVQFGSGPCLWEVQADGDWSLKPR